MGRATGLLKPVELGRLAQRNGMHCDGGGLYLRVARENECSWVLRYMIAGRARTMGLGPFPEITLARAREKALEARRLKAEGVDPIEAKRAQRAAAATAAANAMTFKQCATRYIAAHRAGWKNEKHAAQWGATLETYVYPDLGALPVQAIEAALVLKVLEPIWATKPETATRVRGRLEAILDWATARKVRTGDNPARWRGHLDKLLPARSKVQKVKHQPALAFTALPAFMGALDKQDGVAARALAFAILTAARSGEVLEATWDEIDFDAKVWTVPAKRMKADREHRVPLSAAALAILKGVKPKNAEATDYIFPGGKHGRPLSNMAMTTVIRRMNELASRVRGPKWLDPRQDKEIVPHGFRSTFRDWAAEATGFPHEMAEMALAHAVGAKVEAAYRRGDMFKKRLAMMTAWANFCGATGA